MMDRSLYKNTFQKELRAFMKDLIKVFPEDRDMKILSSSLNIAMMDDPEDKVMYRFYDTLLKFEGLIDTRNDQFFYEAGKVNSDISLFTKLDVYWTNLHSDNRKIVWDYLQVLFLLSKSYFVQNR
jgi:hypothetical protein